MRSRASISKQHFSGSAQLELYILKRLREDAVLEVGDGVSEVLSTSGDTHLGGNDFDKRIDEMELVKDLPEGLRRDIKIYLCLDLIRKMKSKPSSKKNQGQVSRINKAERDKMKREHLNDLFVALVNALGDWSAYDVLDKQIECLKRENEALLSEFQYVTSENNELQVENSATQDQIEKLQKVLNEKMSQINLDLNIAPPEPTGTRYNAIHGRGPYYNTHLGTYIAPTTSCYSRVCNPVCPHFPVHQQPNENAQYASQPVCNVSKPHARYPSPGDSWPSQLL